MPKLSSSRSCHQSAFPRPRSSYRLDDVRSRMRWRLSFHHRRHAAEHRRCPYGSHPRTSESASAQPRSRLRSGRRFPEILAHGRGRQVGSVRPGGGRFHPERKDQEGRLLGGPRNRSQHRTTHHHQYWIDRLAPKALAVVGAGTCATYGGIHAMEGNPTGCMGLADYLGWDWRSKAGLPIVNVPGCPVQPDNFMETLLYLLYQVAGLAPMIPLDDQLRPTWLVRQHRARRLRSRRLLRTGRFRRRVRLAEMHREAGLLGPGGELQCPQARLDGGNWRLSECRRHLHRLHHAGLPG